MDEMILLSYLRGKCSNEEAKQVENWCEEAQENREVLEQLYYTLFVGDRIAVMNAVDTEMSLDKLKSKIRDKEKIETRKKLVVGDDIQLWQPLSWQVLSLQAELPGAY